MKRVWDYVFGVALLLVLVQWGRADLHTAEGGPLPVPAYTPGETNPDITEGNISQTICDHPAGYPPHAKVPGHWNTGMIRPPSAYTQYLKRKLIERYGYEDKNPKHYELDHLIPLGSGGHPWDPHNLWPQPWRGKCNAKQKDELEHKVNGLICNGTLTLKQAQEMFSRDWTAGYKEYVDNNGCN